MCLPAASHYIAICSLSLIIHQLPYAYVQSCELRYVATYTITSNFISASSHLKHQMYYVNAASCQHVSILLSTWCHVSIISYQHRAVSLMSTSFHVDISAYRLAHLKRSIVGSCQHNYRYRWAVNIGRCKYLNTRKF